MAKPKKFKPGEKVVCVVDGRNLNVKWGTPSDEFDITISRPIFNEIYTIRDYGRYRQKKWWVRLVGMPDLVFYQEELFAPILPDKAIAELIEESLTIEVC
jgi:hypothetical protein